MSTKFCVLSSALFKIGKEGQHSIEFNCLIPESCFPKSIFRRDTKNTKKNLKKCFFMVKTL